jgi:hypothetical protein
MWQTTSLWFEISVVSISFLLGHIFLGHFEERTPSFRKLGKYIFALALVLFLSIYLGRTIALSIYGALFLPVLYIHLIQLPRKGINGWTGEPKGKYYELRKWDKNIFNE